MLGHAGRQRLELGADGPNQTPGENDGETLSQQAPGHRDSLWSDYPLGHFQDLGLSSFIKLQLNKGECSPAKSKATKTGDQRRSEVMQGGNKN